MLQLIRLVTYDDLTTILAIYNDAILTTTAIYDYRPHTLSDRKEWLDKKTAAGIPVFVFEQDGHVIGYATYGPFRDFPAYKYSAEHSIYVHKDQRHLRVGTQLMQALMEVLNQKGYMTLIGAIDADNEASCRMHEKMGFQLVGTIEKAGYKFGRWLTLQFYRYELKGPAMPTEE